MTILIFHFMTATSETRLQNNERINFSEMFSRSNGEALENSVVDKEAQRGSRAEAIRNDPCASTASSAMVGLVDMTPSVSPEMETTLDSMSKEIAKDLVEHYTELTHYAVVMNEIIDTLNNKLELQSEAYEEQKMGNACDKTEKHESLNCLSPVHQFVGCMQDYMQIVFDSLEDDKEADDCFDGDYYF